MKKKLSLLMSVMLLAFVLTGCSIEQTPITAENAAGFWETIFVLPLANFITWLYNLLGQNLGFAVILATATVRLVLMPIYAKSNKSMAVMQEIQPKMQAVQKKYEGRQDPASQQKMQAEMMKLYQEYNYNPMMGCLLPFLQMPVFFAFYQAIYRHPLIEQAETANFFGINLGSTGGAENIVLAIFVALLTYVSQKMLSSRQPQQNSNAAGAQTANTMMKVMNIYFPFAMFSITVGTPFAFGLYFLTGSIMTIVQSLIFRRK